MAKINFAGFGFNAADEVAANKSLTAAHSGVVQNVVANATITLPATAAGLTFPIRIGADGLTVAISPNSADGINGGGNATGTDNKDIIFTNQPAGSFVVLVGNGAAGYTISAVNGEFTQES